MAATSQARKRVLVTLLVLGAGLFVERLAALATADDDAAEVVTARARTPRAASSPADGGGAIADADAVLRVDRLEERVTALRSHGDRPPAKLAKAGPFDSVSWAPPAPPAAKPPPPPKPTPPPFPYTYMGSMRDDGARTAFFNQGERALAIKVGDVVDERFRVDAMTDQQMQLTYLPLNQGVTVTLGGLR